LDIFQINNGYYIYYEVIKKENQKITNIEYIGSNSKQCKLPIMGEIVNLDIKDIGFPKSENFFIKINNLIIESGEYILEMKCLKVGAGGFVRDFYEGIHLYKKKIFNIKNKQNKKEDTL
jgi:hypothetical protein